MLLFCLSELNNNLYLDCLTVGLVVAFTDDGWRANRGSLGASERVGESVVTRARAREPWCGIAVCQRWLLVLLNPGVRWVSLGGGAATTLGALA